jgi:hypothetical protein
MPIGRYSSTFPTFHPTSKPRVLNVGTSPFFCFFDHPILNVNSYSRYFLLKNLPMARSGRVFTPGGRAGNLQTQNKRYNTTYLFFLVFFVSVLIVLL